MRPADRAALWVQASPARVALVLVILVTVFAAGAIAGGTGDADTDTDQPGYGDHQYHQELVNLVEHCKTLDGPKRSDCIDAAHEHFDRTDELGE